MRVEVVTNPYGKPPSPFRDEPPVANIPGVLVQGTWSSDITAYMLSNDLRGLYLNYTKGWKCDSYAFLKELPWLTLLDIIDVPIADAASICNLTSLTHLSIQAQINGSADFGALEQLRQCHITWRRGVKGIFDCCSLEKLDIRGVKDAELAGLARLRSLKTLTLQSNIRSLAPLAALEKLEKLELIDCTNLEDLSALENFPKLRWLAIDGSKKLGDLSTLSKTQTLEVLDLSNIGAIPSLTPIAGLKRLRALAFAGASTSIQDGDLSVLESLPDLSMLMFAPRKHYSHRLVKQWDWSDFYRPGKLLEPKPSQPK